MKFHLAIISTGRQKNVEFMQSMCEPSECHWYVNFGEYDIYKQAGAHYVFESGENICEARNLALQHAFEKTLPCIQISDDLRNIKRVWLNEKKQKMAEFTSVEYVCNTLIEKLSDTGLLYGGVAITNNPLNYDGQDISANKLIVNDFICMMPSAYRFDDNLALKEDYDMSIKQLIEVGGVLRLNNILCDFPHRQNEGGANSYRNQTTEGEATQKLIAKWPNYVKMNPRRPGQVLLNYKAIREAKDTTKNNLFDL